MQHSLLTEKPYLLVNEKGDVLMAKRYSKVQKQGMSFQLPAIRKLCQDACQHLMLHPDEPGEDEVTAYIKSTQRREATARKSRERNYYL